MNDKRIEKIARKLDRNSEKIARSVKDEMVDLVYDTLMQNTNYPQLKVENVVDGSVDASSGIIEFSYRLDEAFTDDGVEKINPVELSVSMKIDVG